MVELGEQPVMGEQVELEVVEKNLLSQDLDFSKYFFSFIVSDEIEEIEDISI